MKVTKLEDYKVLAYFIRETVLEFDIRSTKVFVKAKLAFEKNLESNSDLIVLNGVDLKLHEIEYNGQKFCDYELKDDKLVFRSKDECFELMTKVEIDPYSNYSCEGLYKSGDILCTQNEAEGFRKITYYYDRPDCMSKFTTTIIADAQRFPYLLANGNVSNSEVIDGKKKITWVDPYAKPAYLFALVAGDLCQVSDKFTTKSGRVVDLEIFVDHGNEDKCDHAMQSLKDSMRWDEDVYGLEYDLDIYMIVAVDSFNMGAMENKGLNIFNSAYVLAKQQTATDENFQAVQAVIGHEYFHNWTGNRVTCRDWFQLTLKEGLTVFRDQEFSADMLSRPVKRIEDVKTLRAHQFPEDDSSLAHPIKPKEYAQMNNFYTATVYEKGAEVIRMIHTIIGKENFKKAMDLYFKRHDGHAVTTEDFVAAMSDASGYDLEQFKVWYDQSGTPKVKVRTALKDNEFILNLEQNAKLNNNNYDALHIPLKVALFDRATGKIIENSQKLIELKKKKEIFSWKQIACKDVVLSFNRDFSAPIKVDLDQSVEELIFLAKYDDDDFNRYESMFKLYALAINGYLNDSIDNSFLDQVLDVYKEVLVSDLDEAYKAYLLKVPSYLDILKMQDQYKVQKTYEAVEKFLGFLVENLNEQIKKAYEDITFSEFDLSAKQMGQRALKNLLLGHLAYNKDNYNIVKSHYTRATNMTDEIASLKHLYLKYDDFEAMKDFASRWKDQTLVMQKWFGLSVQSKDCDAKKLEQLCHLDSFDIKVPNLARSLFSVYVTTNLVKVLEEDNFDYVLEKIFEIDKFNAQVSARVARGFSYINKLDSGYKELLVSKIKQKLEKNKPSSDLYEILTNLVS
ncbi:MAG: aminopeptidase N [Bacteriovoracaceae bacterium]|jgi:aminopeptidase N|nr:aminopeptidase N [Bacteriovoracaceae bacterium]